MEENGLTFKEYPDGRTKIDLDSGTGTAGLRNLRGILGYRSSNGPTYTPHISDRPVDIHDGLRYITVSCDIVNREHNIGMNPEWNKFLHWVDGWRSVLPDMIFRPNKDFKMDVHSFKVYVTETESFVTKLDPIKPTYNKPKGTFIDKLSFDYHSNSYFCSLAAAYVATFKCGISEDHLTNNLPDSHSNIVTSIVRFHLHFHLSRFMRNPKLLDQYITKDDIWTIRKFTPVHETWEKRTDSSHANLGTWYYDKPADAREARNTTSKISSN